MSGLDTSSYGVKNILSVSRYFALSPFVECSCIKVLVRLFVLSRTDMVVYGSRERPSLSFELQKGKDLVALHEATPSGVRLDAKILGVSVEPDVVKNRIVEFVSKLALKRRQRPRRRARRGSGQVGNDAMQIASGWTVPPGQRGTISDWDD